MFQVRVLAGLPNRSGLNHDEQADRRHRIRRARDRRGPLPRARAARDLGRLRAHPAAHPPAGGRLDLGLREQGEEVPRGEDQAGRAGGVLRRHPIPMENVVEMVKGEKRASKRKFFPGYILVQMELNDRTWHLVKNTPKITGFVGNATKPPAVSEHEIARLTTQLSEGALKPKPKVEFEEGDNVRVVDGPFSNFNGTVEEVNPDKGRVRVLVSIFGRATPVELDFMQVEKT